MKDKQQILGGPEITFCVTGLAACFPTADLGFTLTGTYTMQQATHKGNSTS